MPYIAVNRFDTLFFDTYMYIQNMPIDLCVSQMILCGIDGKTTLPLYTKKYIQTLQPGGILLFRYNISETTRHTKDFIAQINALYYEQEAVEPFIAIDHEGGEVQRLRGIVDTLEAAYTVAHTMDEQQASSLYMSSAKQLADIGITLNLAPVVEVLSEQNKKFLQTRSFGSMEEVITYGSIFIECFQNEGIIATAKHFPGNTSDDPHFGLPIIRENRTILYNQFIYPFKELFNQSGNKKPRSLLLSHAIVQDLDSVYPACLSQKIVSGIIRTELQYTGLILSDDVRMAALEKNGFSAAIAAIAAVNAGVNMIMISGGDIKAVHEVLVTEAQQNPIFMHKVTESVYKILEAKRFIREAQ